jgi:hypothetical protein
MMLRILVALLVVANLAVWAWTQGWMPGPLQEQMSAWLGSGAQTRPEPERLERQVRASQLVLMDDKALSAEKSRLAATACVQAGPFADADYEAAKALVSALVPSSGIQSVSVNAPPVFWVYMGKYASAEQLAKKIEELRKIKLSHTEVSAPAEWAPGLILGRYDSKTAAEEALAQFGTRGIRTARVVEIPAGASMRLLRVPAVPESVSAQLKALRNPALMQSFINCN